MEFEGKLAVIRQERLAIRKKERKERRKAEAEAARKEEAAREGEGVLHGVVSRLCVACNSVAAFFVDKECRPV